MLGQTLGDPTEARCQMGGETGELKRAMGLFSHLQPSQLLHQVSGHTEEPCRSWGLQMFGLNSLTLQQSLMEQELRARRQYWQLQEQEEQCLAEHLWHLSQELRFHPGHEARLEVRPKVPSHCPHSFRNHTSPFNVHSPCFPTGHKKGIHLRAESRYLSYLFYCCDKTP